MDFYNARRSLSTKTSEECKFLPDTPIRGETDHDTPMMTVVPPESLTASYRHTSDLDMAQDGKGSKDSHTFLAVARIKGGGEKLEETRNHDKVPATISAPTNHFIKTNNSILLLNTNTEYTEYAMTYRAIYLGCDGATFPDRPRGPSQTTVQTRKGRPTRKTGYLEKALDIVRTPWDAGWDVVWEGTGLSIIRVWADTMRVEVVSDDIPARTSSWKVDARLIRTTTATASETVAEVGDDLRIGKRVAKGPDNVGLVYNAISKIDVVTDAGGGGGGPTSKSAVSRESPNDFVYLMYTPVEILKKTSTGNAKKYGGYDRVGKEGGFTYRPVGGKNDSETSVLCPNIHARVEKNWAHVPREDDEDDDGSMMFQYGFSPFQFVKSGGDGDSNCAVYRPTGSNFFERLQSSLGLSSIIPAGHGIAGSSPLIPYTDKLLLGVGHIKLKYTMFGEKKTSHKLSKFVEEFRDAARIPIGIEPADWMSHSPDVHGSLIYTTFFYTVNRKDLSLDRFSDAFIFANSTLSFFPAVSFAMSIQPFSRGDFLLSLGLGDIQCGLIRFSKESIGRKFLSHTNDSDVRDFGFEILNCSSADI